VFAALCERIAYFIDLPPSKAAGITATLALWMMLTYVYPAFDAVPYLYSGGPVGSGKSRVLELLARMVFRPLTTSNLTAACLFRALHNQGGILLLDEAERLRDASPDVADINSVLLAGYKRGGKALRLEPAGDTFKLAEFEVFGPKAIASIAGMPPALASRCIPLTMFRSPPSSVKPRRRLDGDPARWQSLRDDLHRLALENGDTWLDLAQKADVCPEMSGRQFELWQPILALAHWVESSGAEGLLEVVRGHALHTIDDSRDDQLPDTDEVLLRVVSEKVKLGEVFTPGNVLSAAQAKEQVLFQKWSARTVSDRLHRYGIPRPSKHSHGTRLYDGITIDMLLKVQQNYGIDLEISPPSPPKQDLQHAKSNSRLDIDSGGEGGECGEAGRQCREV
jgi:hypothetical protein